MIELTSVRGVYVPVFLPESKRVPLRRDSDRCFCPRTFGFGIMGLGTPSLPFDVDNSEETVGNSVIGPNNRASIAPCLRQAGMLVSISLFRYCFWLQSHCVRAVDNIGGAGGSKIGVTFVDSVIGAVCVGRASAVGERLLAVMRARLLPNGHDQSGPVRTGGLLNQHGIVFRVQNVLTVVAP